MKIVQPTDKRRFWISKIVLFIWIELLLLVVLSTASYAWYTISSRIEIGSITFQASSKGYLPDDLLLSFDKENFPVTQYGSSISFDTEGDVIYPMVPKTLPTLEQTDWSTFTQSFNSAQEQDGLNGKYFTNVKDETAYTLSSTEDQPYFYMQNRSPSDLLITVSPTISSNLRAQLRTAVFVGDAENATTILGIYAVGSQSIHYGELVNGNSIDEVNAVEKLLPSDGKIKFIIKAGEIKAIRLVVWFDGNETLQSHSGQSATVSYYFHGTHLTEDE